MAAVCNWLNIFFCQRGTPKIQHQVHPNNNNNAFDAVIVWKGKETKQQKGGVAYEVILKPASSVASPRPPSPPKMEKGLTEHDIRKKLDLAAERRESLEAKKLECIAKERVRAQEAAAKVIAEQEEFSQTTREKLRRSMEVNKENRESQIKELQDRLRDHLDRIKVVNKLSAMSAKELEGKLANKFVKYEDNRRTQLEGILHKLKEHANHVEDVCKYSGNNAKSLEEKIMLKMENALKNRENQITALQEKLKDHEKKIEEVRKNKTLPSDTSIEEQETS